jgi:glutamine amidotransferase
VTYPKIVVLDFGSGNIHSVVNAFSQLGAEVELTADRSKALQADGLVIRGCYGATQSSRRA